MKSVTVQVEREELDRLLKQVAPGDEVVLTDGDRKLALERFPTFDVNEDSDELGEELLKALRTRTSGYSRRDLEEVARRVRGEKLKE